MKYTELFESRIDNQNGAGVTPNTIDIDYFGTRVLVKPSTFLALVTPLDNSNRSAGDLKKYMENGGKIASPFLTVSLPEGWTEGDFSQYAVIKGHEGRNRMYALMDLDGDIPVEVHLFYNGGIRSKNITEDMLRHLNQEVIPEGKKAPVKGPWFRTY